MGNSPCLIIVQLRVLKLYIYLQQDVSYFPVRRNGCVRRDCSLYCFVFFNIFVFFLLIKFFFFGREKCAGWFAGDKEREEGMIQSWRTKCARINLNRFVGWQKRRREIIIIKQDQGYKIKTNAAHRVTNELINNNHQFIWKKKRERCREKKTEWVWQGKNQRLTLILWFFFLSYFFLSLPGDSNGPVVAEDRLTKEKQSEGLYNTIGFGARDLPIYSHHLVISAVKRIQTKGKIQTRHHYYNLDYFFFVSFNCFFGVFWGDSFTLHNKCLFFVNFFFQVFVVWEGLSLNSVSAGRLCLSARVHHRHLRRRPPWRVLSLPDRDHRLRVGSPLRRLLARRGCCCWRCYCYYFCYCCSSSFCGSPARRAAADERVPVAGHQLRLAFRARKTLDVVNAAAWWWMDPVRSASSARSTGRPGTANAHHKLVGRDSLSARRTRSGTAK